MTVIYTAYSQPDALALDSILRASDIDSQLLDIHHSTLQSHLIQAIGIRVAVPDSQADWAADIVEDFVAAKRARPVPKRADRPDDEAVCPRCGSKNVETDLQPRRIMSLILGLSFMLPFVLRRQVHECQDCGAYWKTRALKGEVNG